MGCGGIEDLEGWVGFVWVQLLHQHQGREHVDFLIQSPIWECQGEGWGIKAIRGQTSKMESFSLSYSFFQSSPAI